MYSFPNCSQNFLKTTLKLSSALISTRTGFRSPMKCLICKLSWVFTILKITAYFGEMNPDPPIKNSTWIKPSDSTLNLLMSTLASFSNNKNTSPKLKSKGSFGVLLDSDWGDVGWELSTLVRFRTLDFFLFGLGSRDCKV